MAIEILSQRKVIGKKIYKEITKNKAPINNHKKGWLGILFACMRYVYISSGKRAKWKYHEMEKREITGNGHTPSISASFEEKSE